MNNNIIYNLLRTSCLGKWIYLSDSFSGAFLKFCFEAEQKTPRGQRLLPDLPKMASRKSHEYVSPLDFSRALFADFIQYL
jgi:hypothetical protein